MKLSILIPEFNQMCFPLAFELHKQCIQEEVEFEIIVADDASTNVSIVAANRPINQLEHAVFLEESSNRGRAAIRNFLVAKAQGTYLLFVDSDATVPDAFYIKRYLDVLDEGKVVYGGVMHRPEKKGEGSLRLRYELACDQRFTLAYRQKNPYQHLRTLNILIPASIAHQYPFDENIQLYGYEDTLLGHCWEKTGIEILHIENPLIDADMESNEIFLHKTEEALHTLHDLGNQMEKYSSLLHCYNTLQKWNLLTLFQLFFRIFKSLIRKNLLGKTPKIGLFQVYKLGYYSNISKETSK